MITIVDYGLGNIKAFANVYKRLNISACYASTPEQLQQASKIILPGVGAFDHAMHKLNTSGLRETLDNLVLEKKVPVIGICVGMQLLATRGLEHGETPGLGWIAGEVAPIARTDPAIKVPHMGWNDVQPMARHAVDQFGAELVEPGEAYFLHSYHFAPEEGRDIAAMTDHGGGLVAAVRRDNILGVQFHPEKSQRYGIGLLARFLDWRP